jgi:glucokinase
VTEPQRPDGGASAPTIGIDLGGTNLRVAVVDHAGAVLADERVESPDDVDGLLDAMVATTTSLMAQCDGVAAVGAGAAGLVDHDGTVHYAPNLPMLIEVELGRLLGERLPVPVAVDNDANVAGWGELAHGAAVGVSNALVVTLGTGVGGAIVLDGRVHRGAHGFAAEIGHWQFDPRGARCACGETGHWEACASGTALGRMAREAAAAGSAPNVLARAGGDITAVTGRMVGESAAAGEADGAVLLAEYAEAVALGFAGLANILDPELIVVSGGLIVLGEVLLDPVRDAFRGHLEGADHRPDVPIVAAALGEHAGVVGAAVLARGLVV